MHQSYRRRVADIAKKKGSVEVFGACQWSGHCFVHIQHSSDEIESLEKELGVRLPEEYVQFLTEVGSGAGPYYGLFPPAKILSEISCRKSAIPSATFPFQKSDAEAIRSRLDNHDSDAFGEAPWLCEGCIPICEHGCTLYSVLVTSGELRGTGWDVNDDGAVAQWQPAGRPPGLPVPRSRFVSLPEPPCPPTFLQWYESWIERLETDLPD
jgi:hypothetical protein